MARIGISFEQVAAVADTILGAGRQPTIQAVREALGTGSPNTIHRHLSTWRTARPQATTLAIEVPAELSAAFLSALDRTAATARAEKENQIVILQAEATELTGTADALEIERDELAEQSLVLTTDRDRWEATATERQAEIERQSTELLRERAAAEQARIETAQGRNKLELQSERLNEQSVEISTLRTALDNSQQARQQAEQAAAVAAARLEAANAALTAQTASAAARLEAEIEQRKALAEQLAEVTKRATSTADQLAHEKVSGQACQARLEAAAREIASANEAAATARAAAKKSGEEAAELRGQLATVSNVTTVKTVKKQPVKKGA